VSRVAPGGSSAECHVSRQGLERQAVTPSGGRQAVGAPSSDAKLWGATRDAKAKPHASANERVAQRPAVCSSPWPWLASHIGCTNPAVGVCARAGRPRGRRGFACAKPPVPSKKCRILGISPAAPGGVKLRSLTTASGANIKSARGRVAIRGSRRGLAVVSNLAVFRRHYWNLVTRRDSTSCSTLMRSRAD
jgi:hypothetical protein